MLLILYAGLFNVAEWMLPASTIQSSKTLQPLLAIDMVISVVVINFIIIQSSKLRLNGFFFPLCQKRWCPEVNLMLNVNVKLNYAIQY